MTINMAHFEELRMAILSGGEETVIRIKKEIGESLESAKYIALNGEDPTGGWYLYLDALCNMRLGAFAWDGSVVAHFTRGSLDLLADWYEALCEVARSVNRRQTDGRGGCNEEKFRALVHFKRKNNLEITALLNDVNKYARYLQERTEQIEQMHETGHWRRLDKIEAFRGN